MNIMSKVLNKGLYISLFVAVIFFSANSYQRSLDADLPKIKKSFLFSIFDFEFNLADFDVLELISIEKDGVRFLVYTSEYEPTSINAASMQEVVSLILYDANSLSGKNRLGLKGVCSGLIDPDTLIRDNPSQTLRCQYEQETSL